MPKMRHAGPSKDNERSSPYDDDDDVLVQLASNYFDLMNWEKFAFSGNRMKQKASI